MARAPCGADPHVAYVALPGSKRRGQGQHQFAVVLAQAACELRTEDAIIELMRRKKAEFLSDALLGFVSTTSLADGRILKVFVALTGDDPSTTVW